MRSCIRCTTLNPVYFILLPNIVLISILLSTHTQRYPNGTGDDLGTDPISGHHILDDPIEGSPEQTYKFNGRCLVSSTKSASTSSV
ncbi:hypothetical protein H4Q26_018011 [Puccinia striiformis f. sp. tritici PST-130]|nr:hypothetical protein H4Q26_018011 [Puccinia striiformis f. sp. tritici PST-130]